MTLDILIHLILLLGLAKIFGEIMERLGLSGLLGYVLAGVICGRMVFNIVPPGEIELFSTLGAILLLFVVGFKEGNIDEMVQNKEKILTIMITGYAAPFLITMLIAFFFNMPLATMLLFAVAVSATSIGTTIKTLVDLGKINSPVGRTLLGVTVVDGIAGLIIFTAVLTYISVGQAGYFEIIKVLGSVVAFFLLFFGLNKIAPWVMNKAEYLSVEEGQFTFAFIFILFLSVVAELMGLHGVIGAFLAGIILSRSRLVETNFLEKISALSYSLFVPLFFVWTGLILEFNNLGLISFAVVGGVLLIQFLVSTTAAYVTGMKEKDRLMTGIGMLPRGGVNLVIISVGMKLTDSAGNYLIPRQVSQLIFSTVMLLILLSVLLTPTLLKFVAKGYVKK